MNAIELGRLLQSAVQTLDASLKLTVVPSAGGSHPASSRHTVQIAHLGCPPAGNERV
jgi:hypothetical protein